MVRYATALRTLQDRRLAQRATLRDEAEAFGHATRTLPLKAIALSRHCMHLCLYFNPRRVTQEGLERVWLSND
ncbi:hypothetical protein [Moorena producens]|uniref:hypothetical protein n=1 Tax=Moorena producens TaxID=1155739 RepID=UPI003C7333EC